MKAALQPHWATSIGIPGHDGEVARYKGQNVSRPLRRAFGIRRNLTSFSEDSLSISTWVDQQLLLAEIQTFEYWFSGQVTWRRSPLPYTDAIIEGITSLMLSGREDSLSEYLASRLAKIPDVIADARENITDPIKLHCEVAAEDLRAFLPFLDAASLEAWPAVENSIVTPGIIETARSSIQNFTGFIDSLAVGGEPAVGLGPEEYSGYLTTAFMLEEPLENIVSEAERTLDQAKQKKKSMSGGGREHRPIPYFIDGIPDQRERDPIPDWREGLVSTVKLLDMLDLLAVTSGDGLVSVKPLPPLVPGSPVYMPPALSSDSLDGTVYLRSPERRKDGDGVDRTWRWAEPLLSRYPALHPAEVRLHDNPSAIRRYVRNGMGRSGWNLYFSVAMANPVPVNGEEQAAKWARLAYYAASAIAEIRIHTREWTIDEAANFIAEETGRDPELALQDARRYAVAPGSGIGYLLGRREIIRLRERYKKVKRNSFDLEQFHDTLLSCGYLPPYLLSIEVMSKGMGRE